MNTDTRTIEGAHTGAGSTATNRSRTMMHPQTPVRYDLMMWTNGALRRFDSATTLADAVMTLRVHDDLNDELGDGMPLNAEVWAVYADGSATRAEVTA